MKNSSKNEKLFKEELIEVIINDSNCSHTEAEIAANKRIEEIRKLNPETVFIPSKIYLDNRNILFWNIILGLH